MIEIQTLAFKMMITKGPFKISPKIDFSKKGILVRIILPKSAQLPNTHVQILAATWIKYAIALKGYLNLASFLFDDIFHEFTNYFISTPFAPIDDYEETVNPIKRNIGSLAAKGGWTRPSRAYNRVPHFSY